MKRILVVIALILIGCQPATPAAPTATPPTSFGDAPHVEDIVVGETTRSEVEMFLGEPTDRPSPDVWHYKWLGDLSPVLIFFDGDIVSMMTLGVTTYTLREMIDDLGTPALVEIMRVALHNSPLMKRFHYPALGIAYEMLCSPAIRADSDECADHYADELVTNAVQYPAMTVEQLEESLWIELEDGRSTLIEWAGFADE